MSSLGEFELEPEPLGSGQFSRVWRARRISDGTPVALKKIQIYGMMDATARNNCIKEVELLMALDDHPNIIKYLSSFVESNEFVLVLELADAGDLASLLRTHRNANRWLDEATVWQIFLQLASAVNHMHANRVMHRDIKPGNTFLVSSGVVKLGDLGLSRAISSKTYVVHSVVGTPYYMSPEQIHEAGYTFKSDIWSLGCLLYEMVTLRQPFEGNNYYVLGKKISTADYVPVAELTTERPEGPYSEGIIELIHRMIKPQPDERPDIGQVMEWAQQGMAAWRMRRESV